MLILILSLGSFAQEGENPLDSALGYYRVGAYEAAAEILAGVIEKGISPTADTEAQVYLLLGICYEMLEKTDRATSCYQKVKSMIDAGYIVQVPQIPGVELESFELYGDVLGEKGFFKYQKPVAVADVLQSQVIHGEGLSLQDLRSRRRFNWKVALGGVVLGTAVVLLAVIKKKSKFPEFKPIDWISIPAGAFTMGGDTAQGEADENPGHNVELDGYEISKYEITVGQFNVYCREKGIPVHGMINQSENRNYFDEQPVVDVTWEDAEKFCQWLSQKTGSNIMLPTEAQWEKAARGTDGRRFPWGNNYPNCSLVSYLGCTDSYATIPNLHHVGTRPGGQSPYGVHDMAGNVMEWCRDYYSPNYYTNCPYKNPCGPDSGMDKVARGGSVANGADKLRTTKRFRFRAQNKNDYLGFRVVREK